MPQDKFIDIGLNIHIRHWDGDKTPFVLVHGLASNCRTWEQVAEVLAEAGHEVITVDQRGHGLSDKPDDGYEFADVTSDLAKLIAALGLSKPVLAGQSWGGNVMLDFGARYPDLARSLGFIDGGFIDLRSRPDATWESVREQLKPPNLIGTPRTQIKSYMQQAHPDWSEAGIEGTLANFETLTDGTIRPWLTQERHLKILRAMWEQTPSELYPKVTVPVLICVAEDASNPEWTAVKHAQVAAAESSIPNVTVEWFANSDHDIHVQHPTQLAQLMIETLL